MFSAMPGGNMSPASWFPWHAVLMTLAFPCLMTIGRWSYVGDSAWAGDAWSRRRIHGAFMTLAAAAMLMGYLCIFQAHLPNKQFLGYNFETHTWVRDWKRIVHVYLGYTVILLVLFQILLGLCKYARLSLGEGKTLAIHGILGALTTHLAAITLLMAIWFWSWDPKMKGVMVFFTLATSMFASRWPRAAKSEREPILGESGETRSGSDSDRANTRLRMP